MNHLDNINEVENIESSSYLIASNRNTNCIRCGDSTHWYDEGMRAFVCSERCANLLFEDLSNS